MLIHLKESFSTRNSGCTNILTRKMILSQHQSYLYVMYQYHLLLISILHIQSMSAGVPAAFIIAHFIVTHDRMDLEQGLFGNVFVASYPGSCERGEEPGYEANQTLTLI